MGLDRFQVTEGRFNFIREDRGLAVAHDGISQTLPSELVTQTRHNLSKDFYTNSWFRALNDIQNSETFMCHLDNIYWEVKSQLQIASDAEESLVPLKNKEVIYKLDLGPSISDEYFVEIRFNFYSDEITLGIGQEI